MVVWKMSEVREVEYAPGLNIEYNWRHVFSIVFLEISLFYVARIASIGPQIVGQYGIPYLLMFFSPKILPITIMGLYCLTEFKIQFLNRTLRLISCLSLIVGLAAFFVLLSGLTFNLSPNTFFGFYYDWSYEASVEWSFCFVVAWILTEVRTKDLLFSLAYSAQAICVGGMIHEWFFMPLRYDLYYHPTYPLFIATSWLSLFFVLLLMYDNKWHNHFLFSISLIIYSVFSIFYLTGTVHFETMWMQRLPTILLLILLPLGFKRKGEV